MGGAHGNGIGGDIQCGIQRRYRNFKGGIALGVSGQILLAVHDHIIIVRAAPHDGGGHLAIRHGQGCGAVHSSTARAALQRHITGVGAVCRGLGFRSLFHGITHADDMVVPLALGAQNGKVKVRIHSSDRNVKAVHLLRGAVGIGDGICGGLQPIGLVVGGIGSLAQIQVDDMGGSKADMEGHLAVLHGQGALAVAGFVGVEHAAVGVKLGGIHTIRQSGGLSGRRSHRGCRLGRSSTGSCRRCRGRSAAAHQQTQCQRSSDNTGKNAFHGKYLYIIKISFYYTIVQIKNEPSPPDAAKRPRDGEGSFDQPFRESIAALVWATYSFWTSSISPRPAIWQSMLSKAPEALNWLSQESASSPAISLLA